MLSVVNPVLPSRRSQTKGCQTTSRSSTQSTTGSRRRSTVAPFARLSNAALKVDTVVSAHTRSSAVSDLPRTSTHRAPTAASIFLNSSPVTSDSRPSFPASSDSSASSPEPPSALSDAHGPLPGPSSPRSSPRVQVTGPYSRQSRGPVIHERDTSVLHHLKIPSH